MELEGVYSPAAPTVVSCSCRFSRAMWPLFTVQTLALGPVGARPPQRWGLEHLYDSRGECSYLSASSIPRDWVYLDRFYSLQSMMYMARTLVTFFNGDSDSADQRRLVRLFIPELKITAWQRPA